jgi:hypothetical protein
MRVTRCSKPSCTSAQRQGHGAAADVLAFVLDDEARGPVGALAQDVDGQAVLEVDLAGLAAQALAEAGAAVVGVAFQVQRAECAAGQLREQLGLARAGQPAEHDEAAFARRGLQRLDEEAAQGLIAPLHARIVDAGFTRQPLLHDLRAQAAAKAVEHAVRVRAREIGPGLDAVLPGLAADQAVAQRDGGLLALPLVAGADGLAFAVVHERQVDHAGKRALCEFDGRAHVHHGHAVQEDAPQIGPGLRHQRTTTATSRCASRWPMGARLRPSLAAACRNSASPSGVTATSRPPLVCGSHSRCFCASFKGAMRVP